MAAVALLLSWGVRWQGKGVLGWQGVLGYFLFPPVLLWSTAVATLGMCPDHLTLLHGDDYLMHGLALGLLGLTVGCGMSLVRQGRHLNQLLRDYPQIMVRGRAALLMPEPSLFIAQVGFWKTQLVVSQGLLNALSPGQLEAALCHEEAHAYYRDTFWFFWLGWVQRATAWLPQSRLLWQELLALRELRADRWSCERTDPLLLAEALLLVVAHPTAHTQVWSAGMADTDYRLGERVQALLQPLPTKPTTNWLWVWLLLALLPLLAIPLHLGCLV